MFNVLMVKDSKGRVMPIIDMSDSSQTVDGSLASAQSTVIDAVDRSLVRIAAIDDVYVQRGANPTATTNSLYLAAGGEIYLPVTAGHKIAVLGGKANITAGV